MTHCIDSTIFKLGYDWALAIDIEKIDRDLQMNLAMGGETAAEVFFNNVVTASCGRYTRQFGMLLTRTCTNTKAYEFNFNTGFANALRYRLQKLQEAEEDEDVTQL